MCLARSGTGPGPPFATASSRNVRPFRSPTVYSATTSPEPPNSAGKSFSFGNPSRIGSTVSA